MPAACGEYLDPVQGSGFRLGDGFSFALCAADYDALRVLRGTMDSTLWSIEEERYRLAW